MIYKYLDMDGRSTFLGKLQKLRKDIEDVDTDGVMEWTGTQPEKPTEAELKSLEDSNE